jgi:translation elongation factor EF-Tu-like GTPase
MIQTFQFRTETIGKTFHHTVYAVDAKAAVEKWVKQIEDLQNQVYSFNTTQVQNIKQEFSNGQMKVQVDKEPFFLVYQNGDSPQAVSIDKINKGEPDFIARVTYLLTAEGGRQGYAVSGYRPHIKFDGGKQLTSSEQLFVDRDRVFPGETVITEIRTISKEIFKNYLYAGQHFELVEAAHLVARGEILDVVNPDLQQANR